MLTCEGLATKDCSSYREIVDESAGEADVVKTEVTVRAPPAPGMKPLPFNLRRLKTVHLKQIAASMSLPTSGSDDEVSKMIEGRHTEMDKEPHHTSVCAGNGGRWCNAYSCRTQAACVTTRKLQMMTAIVKETMGKTWRQHFKNRESLLPI